MIQQRNQERVELAYDRIQRATSTIERAASIISSLQATTKVCKKCNCNKDIEDFPIVVAYYRIKTGELKQHKARRNVCQPCYYKQTLASKNKRCKEKADNYLF